MTVFRKTILGKILGGTAKVALPVVGAITGIGAITGLIKGVGVVAGIGAAAKAVGKGVDAVAKSAVKLVSGVTAEQRDLIQAQKEETRLNTEKLTTIERLIKAGSTVEKAAASVGIPLSDLTGLFGIPSTEQVKQEAVAEPAVPAAVKTEGCAALFIALLAIGSVIAYAVVQFVILS